MKILLFIYKRGLINRIKHAAKKPIMYVYAIGIVAYSILMIGSLVGFVLNSKFDTPEYLLFFLCGSILFMNPSNFISYSKRKGLLFTQSDLHFVFTAPISPKKVLLFAHMKTILFEVIMMLATVLIGNLLFRLSIVTMLFCVVITSICDGILQACMVILLYGSERLSESVVKIISKVFLVIILVLAGVLLWVLYQNEFRISALVGIFTNPFIQMVPILGWEMGAVELIIVGPTTVNVIGTILFVLTTVICLFLAIRMKCTGGYYEDAMKFADDYQEARAQSKKGKVAVIGKKQKFKRAKVVYKGSGAKAIFFRQLLEYKKSRFFIFSFNTLIYLGGGSVVSYAYLNGKINQPHILMIIMVPLIMMYITLIFSGYQTKWERELESPYTFLIPDSAMKKLWYATLMEHIRSGVSGLLLSLPIVIVFQLPIWYLPLYVLINIFIQAIKLYSDTVCESLLGNLLGKAPKMFLRVIIMWTAIGVCIPIGVVVFLATNIELSMLAMVFYLFLLSIGLMALSSIRFQKMEMLGLPE